MPPAVIFIVFTEKEFISRKYKTIPFYMLKDDLFNDNRLDNSNYVGIIKYLF